MPANYTIEKIVGSEDDGEWISYGCLLAGSDAPPDRGVRVGWKKGSNFDPPTEGDELFGEIKTRKDGSLYFKRESRGGGGGGSSDNPETRGSIERQTAAKCTATVAAGAVTAGTKGDELLVMIDTVFDLFVSKISGASAEASSNGHATPADETIPF